MICNFETSLTVYTHHYPRQPDVLNFANPEYPDFNPEHPEISGVSGLIPRVSGFPSLEFPGLYPELSPECSKSGVSGFIPGVFGFHTVFAPKN